jgi:hypothetical protein
MELRIEKGLPYVMVEITFQGATLRLDQVILDTGSAGTVFSVEKLVEIGLVPAREDRLREIHGIGGTEYVFTKRVQKLTLGTLYLSDFEIEIGAMDYFLDLDGIIGLDFLLPTKAVVDFSRLEVYATL